jgi:hypothetical protein
MQIAIDEAMRNFTARPPARPPLDNGGVRLRNYGMLNCCENQLCHVCHEIENVEYDII